ncbi:hypothetical protein CHS0354_019134 [Potamilus streckersoni]|uniref:Uncharacterized protein n=1 Tax=Potamilus streckersoni TaxID=2493646 RepID=A0AAE0W4F9_9BIVA|nr:hypothetical protein CHS0354_019134 [Potamilus streckersoni]
MRVQDSDAPLAIKGTRCIVPSESFPLPTRSFFSTDKPTNEDKNVEVVTRAYVVFSPLAERDGDNSAHV